MGDGTDPIFEPAFYSQREQCIREVEILAKAKHMGLPSKLRISRPSGIAVSDDVQTVLGYVIEDIPSIGDLYSQQAMHLADYHGQWKGQVLETAKELHRHGIILGSVSPSHVVIDMQKNAWVMGFGRGWEEPFVTQETYGTAEGDLAGVKMVFEDLVDRVYRKMTAARSAREEDLSSLMARKAKI